MEPTEQLASMAEQEDALDSRWQDHMNDLPPKGQQYGYSLAAQAIQQEFAGLHLQYVRLAIQGSCEAAKRSVYHHWICLADPPFLTPSSRLHDYAVEHSLCEFAHLARTNPWDAEFLPMLKWYLDLCPYMASPGACGDTLTRMAESFKWGLTGDLGWTEGQFQGRGLMGRYWQAIVDGWNTWNKTLRPQQKKV